MCAMSPAMSATPQTSWPSTTGRAGSPPSTDWFNMWMTLNTRGKRLPWPCTLTPSIRTRWGTLTASCTRVLTLIKKRLERQISQGVAIMRSNAEVSEDRQSRILMSLKNEPAVHSTLCYQQNCDQTNRTWFLIRTEFTTF